MTPEPDTAGDADHSRAEQLTSSPAEQATYSSGERVFGPPVGTFDVEWVARGAARALGWTDATEIEAVANAWQRLRTTGRLEPGDPVGAHVEAFVRAYAVPVPGMGSSTSAPLGSNRGPASDAASGSTAPAAPDPSSPLPPTSSASPPGTTRSAG